MADIQQEITLQYILFSPCVYGDAALCDNGIISPNQLQNTAKLFFGR